MKDYFLTKLDGMIESTEEFIGDDEVTEDNDSEGRLKDLAALQHVHELYIDVFQEENYMGVILACNIIDQYLKAQPYNDGESRMTHIYG